MTKMTSIRKCKVLSALLTLFENRGVVLCMRMCMFNRENLTPILFLFKNVLRAFSYL